MRFFVLIAALGITGCHSKLKPTENRSWTAIVIVNPDVSFANDSHGLAWYIASAKEKREHPEIIRWGTVDGRKYWSVDCQKSLSHAGFHVPGTNITFCKEGFGLSMNQKEAR